MAMYYTLIMIQIVLNKFPDNLKNKPETLISNKKINIEIIKFLKTNKSDNSTFCFNKIIKIFAGISILIETKYFFSLLPIIHLL
jgi:hypothetical protein